MIPFLVRDELLASLKANLSLTHEMMKLQADYTGLRGYFRWGDWVYLSLQPYKQKYFAYKGKWKLSPRFYGPFQVPQRVEEVAYKLDIHFDSKIHPVFHVSYLKLKLDQYVSPIPTLPSLDETGQLMVEPVAVLHTRTKKFRIRANK